MVGVLFIFSCIFYVFGIVILRHIHLRFAFTLFVEPAIVLSSECFLKLLVCSVSVIMLQHVLFEKGIFATSVLLHERKELRRVLHLQWLLYEM